MSSFTSSFLQASFLASAAELTDLPPEAGPELAFAGRSNVGKSSAINALANRKRLAFASRTPGRTRMINFFELGGGGRLADLPGYGYASAPQALRATWDSLVGGYLSARRCLAGVVLLMDSRRPFTPQDRHFLEWLAPLPVQRLVLLSKSDKLSPLERASALEHAARILDEAAIPSTVMLFSTKDRDSVEAARALLEQWLRDGKTTVRSREQKTPGKREANRGGNRLNRVKATRSGR